MDQDQGFLKLQKQIDFLTSETRFYNKKNDRDLLITGFVLLFIWIYFLFTGLMNEPDDLARWKIKELKYEIHVVDNRIKNLERTFNEMVSVKTRIENSEQVLDEILNPKRQECKKWCR